MKEGQLGVRHDGPLRAERQGDDHGVVCLRLTRFLMRLCNGFFNKMWCIGEVRVGDNIRFLCVTRLVLMTSEGLVSVMVCVSEEFDHQIFACVSGGRTRWHRVGSDNL